MVISHGSLVKKKIFTAKAPEFAADTRRAR
jgi:hypothetical protein